MPASRSANFPDAPEGIASAKGTSAAVRLFIDNGDTPAAMRTREAEPSRSPDPKSKIMSVPPATRDEAEAATGLT